MWKITHIWSLNPSLPCDAMIQSIYWKPLTMGYSRKGLLTLNSLVLQRKTINSKQQWSDWCLDFKNHGTLTLNRITHRDQNKLSFWQALQYLCEKYLIYSSYILLKVYCSLRNLPTPSPLVFKSTSWGILISILKISKLKHRKIYGPTTSNTQASLQSPTQHQADVDFPLLEIHNHYKIIAMWGSLLIATWSFMTLSLLKSLIGSSIFKESPELAKWKYIRENYGSFPEWKVYK